jgi:hypothetical protein
MLNAAGKDVGQLAIWDAPRIVVAGKSIPTVRAFAWVPLCASGETVRPGTEQSGSVTDRGSGRYDLLVNGKAVMNTTWSQTEGTWRAGTQGGKLVTGGTIALAQCA